MNTTLTDRQLDQFEDGTLMHCGRSVYWDSCDDCDSDTCAVAVCSKCQMAWSDCSEFGDN